MADVEVVEVLPLHPVRTPFPPAGRDAGGLTRKHRSSRPTDALDRAHPEGDAAARRAAPGACGGELSRVDAARMAALRLLQRKPSLEAVLRARREWQSTSARSSVHCSEDLRGGGGHRDQRAGPAARRSRSIARAGQGVDQPRGQLRGNAATGPAAAAGRAGSRHRTWGPGRRPGPRAGAGSRTCGYAGVDVVVGHHTPSHRMRRRERSASSLGIADRRDLARRTCSLRSSRSW